jgi:hypothetical protein
MKDWNISRRELLKTLGVGAAVLPVLHAERSFAQTAAAPKNLFIVASGEGMRPFPWTVGPLATQTLPDTLSPLEPFKGDLIFIPKLRNPSYTGCANCGHGAYGAVYYGGATAGAEYKEPGVAGPDGFTVDQVVADAFYAKNPTAAKSLALQVEIDTYLADGTAGAHRCFWRGAGAPVNPLMDPFAAYSMYMLGSKATGMPTTGGTTTGGTPAVDPMAAKILGQKQSILDFVGSDLARFQKRLSSASQQAIENHLTAIRDYEKTLSLLAGGGGGSNGGSPPVHAGPLSFPLNASSASDWMKDQNAMCTGTTFTGASPCFYAGTINYPAVLSLHMQVGVLALAAGVTNVVTLQLVDATGDAKSFVWVQGVPGSATSTARNGQDLHAISHSPMQGGVDVKQRVDKWFMTQFAALIGYMKSVPIGGKTLLDNSLILWGNHMESGDTHLANALPWMMAGSAGGYFKTGQCAATVSNTNTNNEALATICAAMGVMPNKAFGTATLPGLT